MRRRRNKNGNFAVVCVLLFLINNFPASADGPALNLNDIFKKASPQDKKTSSSPGNKQQPGSPASTKGLEAKRSLADETIDPTLVEQSLELLRLSVKCPVPIDQDHRQHIWTVDQQVYEFSGTSSRFVLSAKTKGRRVHQGETREQMLDHESEGHVRYESPFAEFEEVMRDGQRIIVVCKNDRYCVRGFIIGILYCNGSECSSHNGLSLERIISLRLCDTATAESVQIALRQLIAAARPSQRAHFASPGDMVSIWNHNGSEVFLAPDELRRTLVYSRPRDGLYDYNVRSGTILFEGETDGKEYRGNARWFSQRCGAIEYPVHGPASHLRIVLRGKRPIVDSRCQITGYTSDILTFEYKRMDDPF